MPQKADKNYDYIIVGAGSAGCVLAARLAENPDTTVLLIEAGGHDKKLSIKMPSAFYMPLNDLNLNWGYYSEPEPYLNNRRVHCPRGKVLGGSSSINGMVYIRGNQEDFNEWARLGATGWNYESVLPYFKKSQHADNRTEAHPYQGHAGPLATTTGTLSNPLYSVFLDAIKSAGHHLNQDVNGANQQGFGPVPMTVDSGIRASTFYSYLAKPKKERDNLEIVSNALTQRILIKDKTAFGVNYLHRGRQIKATASSEVILSAGAINSPQLLMLSGIGEESELNSHGIEIHSELPGVGKNLMDHLEVYVQQACLKPISLHKHLGLLGKARIGLEWLATGRGLGATNHFEVGGFIRSSDKIPYPDIQFHFLPVAMSYDGKSKASQHGFQVHVGPMLPKSRGKVSLKNSNPDLPPKIEFNYMSDEADFSVFRAAIQAARKIFNQPDFERIRGRELNPGQHCQSEEALNNFIKENAESAYHPCGTCKMGVDQSSVVDPAGRVYGIDSLRVVDASIFPQITNGNLNAPTMMVAERIADLIKAS